jgi:hypothetical protein
MTGKYEVLVTPETWRQGVISRADVAHFLVHAAEDGTHIRETPALAAVAPQSGFGFNALL